jgi:hypothetical protein
MTSSRFHAISFAVLCLAGSALPLHAQAPAGARHMSFGQSSDAPYALVRDGQRTTFVGSQRSDDEVDALKLLYPGNFIWFRQAGKAYIVRDPATLARVAAAWAPADKLGQEMHQYDVQMRAQSETMAALGREMALATRGPKAGRGAAEAIGKRMDAQGKTMDALGKQMGALGKQIDRESKQADADTRTLLHAALVSGTAQQTTTR